MENPPCAAFEDYEEVPETVPLDFSEDGITWVVSKFSGSDGTLGAEAINLMKWILCFGCASKDFKVVVVNMTD